jgi:hypothetical protein
MSSFSVIDVRAEQEQLKKAVLAGIARDEKEQRAMEKAAEHLKNTAWGKVKQLKSNKIK